jgi:hypothetical protein
MNRITLLFLQKQETQMSKIFFLLLLSVTWLLAQNKNMGYLKFESNQDWLIEINDSLKINSADVTELEPGSYYLKARPLLSYNWPAIFIEDTVHIKSSDTLVYALKPEKSTIKQNTYYNARAINKPIVYSDNKYVPAYENSSTLKNTLILTAIATNWLSFYLKRQADDYYDKYRAGSNLKKINNYYDKTQQFDTFSGVMLGVSAAALSTYIYLTLSEN